MGHCGALRSDVLYEVISNLERYRVVRRPPFKSGAAVHVEHGMVLLVASAAVGAC